MTSIQIVKGDLKPSVQATLQNSDGSVVNLTGSTVTFNMSQAGKQIVSKAAVIVNASGGIVRYDWSSGDTNVLGICKAEFAVTFQDGSTQTFPTGEDLYIEFYDRTITISNPYILPDDVVGNLNMTFDQTTGNYTLYGLTVNAATLQAHVSFANNYVNSIIGSSIDQSDPRWLTAWFAALDIACIRLLVVSMGGSLVGAFDYFLGDLRVARAGPYKTAIDATLQGFKEDLSRQMVNLTPVAVTFDLALKGEVPTYRGGLTSP
jgi:hypothetical protein